MTIEANVKPNPLHKAFTMGVSQGGLKREHVVTVTIDFTGITMDQALALCLAGQSLRVTLQNKFRKKGDAWLDANKTIGPLKWDEAVAKQRTVQVVRPMTQEEIIAAALANPAIMAELRKQAGIGEINNLAQSQIEQLNTDLDIIEPDELPIETMLESELVPA